MSFRELNRRAEEIATHVATDTSDSPIAKPGNRGLGKTAESDGRRLGGAPTAPEPLTQSGRAPVPVTTGGAPKGLTHDTKPSVTGR